MRDRFNQREEMTRVMPFRFKREAHTSALARDRIGIATLRSSTLPHAGDELIIYNPITKS